MCMSRRNWWPPLTQIWTIDEHIPPQLYMAIAELLAWLYRIEHGGEPTRAPF